MGWRRRLVVIGIATLTALGAVTSTVASTNTGDGALVGTLTYEPGYEPVGIADPFCSETQWELDADVAQLNVSIDNNAYVGPAALMVQGASFCGSLLSESGYLVELDLASYPVGVDSSFDCQYLGGWYSISNAVLTVGANGDCNIDGTDEPNETVTITATLVPNGALSNGPYVDDLAGHIGFGG